MIPTIPKPRIVRFTEKDGTIFILFSDGAIFNLKDITIVITPPMNNFPNKLIRCYSSKGNYQVLTDEEHKQIIEYIGFKTE